MSINYSEDLNFQAIIITFRLMPNFHLQAAKIPGSAGLAPANQITLGFNLARIKEENGRLTEAGKEYKEILENFPNYLDCYFRLAMIARAQGDYNKAFEWAHKALDLKQGVQGKDANALALTGEFLLSLLQNLSDKRRF